MLDFYEELIGLPIIERSIPVELYNSVLGLTILIVFISELCRKATRMEPLDV